MPFAVVIRSGWRPSNDDANQSPVRQKPLWISSAMKTTPCSRAHAANAGRNPGAGTMKPPSPWIGSISNAATFVPPTCLSMMSIARAAASTPDRPSLYGYDIGAR
jgi:hypothetical protein